MTKLQQTVRLTRLTDQMMSWKSVDLVTLGGAPCSSMRIPSSKSGSAWSAVLLAAKSSHR